MTSLNMTALPSIAKMNTSQLGELFVTSCRYEKIKVVNIPNGTSKTLDGEIKRMINWKINQKFTKVINFGDLHEHIIRLMVYSCKADLSKNISKQENTKANTIEQTILKRIISLEKTLEEMKSVDNQSTGQIEEDLEIERNILETLQKKSNNGETKNNVFEDGAKMKTLARTVYKILLEDSNKAGRLYREIELFSKPIRDSKQDTGGDYRLANASRDRRFGPSKNNLGENKRPSMDNTQDLMNWRSDKNPTKTPSQSMFSNKSSYQPSFSNNAPSHKENSRPDEGQQRNHTVYQPPIGKKDINHGNEPYQPNLNKSPNMNASAGKTNESTYIPPHLRNVNRRSDHGDDQGSGINRNRNKGGGDGEFINFADIHKKKGFDIQLNDFPELGDTTKNTIKPKQNIQTNSNSTFGVLAMDDDNDGVDWEDESEQISTKGPTEPAPRPVKSQSVWGGGKSFVEITRDGETQDRIRKEEIERLKQEEQLRIDEEKKRVQTIPSHKLNLFHGTSNRDESGDQSWEDEDMELNIARYESRGRVDQSWKDNDFTAEHDYDSSEEEW